MLIFELFGDEARELRQQLLVASGLSGLANAGVLAIINHASGLEDSSELKFHDLTLFSICLVTFVVCNKFAFDRTAQVFERALCRVRSRIGRKIARCELRSLEAIGRSELYNRLTVETSNISQSQGMVTAALQAALLVSCIVGYVALLSLPAFIITAALVCGAFAIYLRRQRATTRYLQATARAEIALFGTTTDLLDGFKELKLNRARAESLGAQFESDARTLRDVTVKTYDSYNTSYILSQSFFYVLIGVIVFVLPRLVATYSEVITELTAAILFIIGPLATITSAVPALGKIQVAMQHIHELEARLDGELQGHASADDQVQFGDGPLRLCHVEYEYLDDDGQPGFCLGPIDLEIEAGQILFLVGGNGAGKSTLLKVLTGLYPTTRGEILLGERRIEGIDRPGYRENFSAIFTDFHLFSHLHGLEYVDDDVVNAKLDELRIGDKTRYEDGHFSTLALSTGQRKRIALATAMLEERPICIFDEVAADQDPEFRRHFYQTILPQLRDRGTTLIVATHDDQFFDLADRVVVLDRGRVRQMSHEGGRTARSP